MDARTVRASYIANSKIWDLFLSRWPIKPYAGSHKVQLVAVLMTGLHSALPEFQVSLIPCVYMRFCDEEGPGPRKPYI